ncbi:MAG: hypothetical protein JST66_14120 [Bacteroidetes bacterium]|nr:hypothetical protein [Bacteroidota bacterium]
MRLFLVLIAWSTLSAASQGQHANDLQLLSRTGVHDLRFGISNDRDAKRAFKGSFRMLKGEGVSITEPGCQVREYKVLSSDPGGLVFRFAGPEGTLSRVDVSLAGARFANGIAIGTSTKEEVVRAFGVAATVVEDYDAGYLYVDEAWAEFKFDDRQVLRAVVLHAGPYR